MFNLYRYIAYALIVFTLTACGSAQPAEAAQKAQSIQFLLSQVRASGVALSGGKVDFYEAGATTTRKTVWIDRNKATPAANPYTLDSNGTAALFGDGLYRIVIKDSAGVTKYDRDYISIKEVSGNVYDVADYASLAAAVASIGSTPATLQFASDVTVSANLTIPATLELMPLNGAKINHTTYTISYAGSTARWPHVQVFNGTGVVTITNGLYNPAWFVSASGWVSSSGIGYGITKTINKPVPSRIENVANGKGIQQGVFRKYSSVSAGTDTSDGQYFGFDANFSGDAQTTSATGINLASKVQKDNNSSGSFAWHNFQNYVESDAVAPVEVAAEYAFSQTTNGASPQGSFITSIATGTNQHNLQYGLQITTVDESGAYGSGTKTLSIRHLSTGGAHPAANGGILFGSGGYVNGYRVTNKGERLEAENIASGEHGGNITNGLLVDGTDSQWIDYFALSGTIAVGDVITGVTSGKTGTVIGIYALDATDGRIYSRNFNGSFIAGEFLTVGGVNKAKVNSNNVPQNSGAITNALVAQNVTQRALSVRDATGVELFGISGKGQTYRKLVDVANTATTIDASLGDVFQLGTDTDGTQITDILNGAVGQEITIYGGGGASPMTVDGAGGGATKVNLIGAVDWVGTVGRVLKIGYNGQWREISRN